MAKSITPFTTPEQVLVPDGTYHGEWGGSDVVMDVNGRKVAFRTDVSIKGFGVAVTVMVKDGTADVRVDS